MTLINHHSLWITISFYINVYTPIFVASHPWSTVWCILLLLLHVNYGVKFQNIGKINVAEQYWRHTFQTAMPMVMHTPRLAEQLECPTIAPSSHMKDMCHEIKNMYGNIDRMTDDMHHKLSALDSSIKMLIPDSNQSSPRQRSKVKRTALLPFIGDISHSLFGTATQKDLDILRRHINNMISVDKKSPKRHINIFS